MSRLMASSLSWLVCAWAVLLLLTERSLAVSFQLPLYNTNPLSLSFVGLVRTKNFSTSVQFPDLDAIDDAIHQAGNPLVEEDYSEYGYTSTSLDPDDPNWELDQLDIEWGSLENYQLMDKLGEGTFSEVFQAIDVRNNKSCVAKVLKPVRRLKVKREIKILQDLRNGPNIVTLVDTALDTEGFSPSIVTEFVNATHYKFLYPILNDTEIRFYMFQLLRALDHAHSKGIMHRDIKPANVMIDHDEQKLRVIDWGLSDYYREGESYSHVGSRYWRAPELLAGYEWYTPTSDMWSFGCILAGMIFQQEPFFRGRHNDANQLRKVSKILGTEKLLKWLKRLEVELEDGDFDEIYGWHEERSLRSLLNESGGNHNVSDEVLDLLEKVLVYDHEERLTSKEALKHTYFDPIRETALADSKAYTTWNL